MEPGPLRGGGKGGLRQTRQRGSRWLEVRASKEVHRQGGLEGLSGAVALQLSPECPILQLGRSGWVALGP